MSVWRCACLAWWCCGWLALPAAAATAPAPAASAAVAASATPARIRVVAPGNYPPFISLGLDGKPEGYEADRWRLFQQHTGIPVELEVTDWDNAQRMLQSGRADVIDLIYRTAAREAEYDYSAPYITLPVGIYVDRSIRNVHDVPSLQGIPVGTDRGGACARKLESMGIDDLRQFEEPRDVVRAAIRGNPRTFCMDENRAYHFLSEYGALDRFDRAFVLYTGQFHWAVRKGNTAMLRTVQHGMALITPAETADLHARWLEHPLGLDFTERRIVAVLAVVLLAVLLMALWVWMLRHTVATRTRDLRVEKAKLRALFDASPDAMWVKDLQGVYRECNDRVATVLRMDRTRLLGHTDRELFSAGFAATAQELDARTLRHGGRHVRVLTVDAGDGPVRQLEVVNVPLRRPDGVLYATLGAARDITERSRIEGELRLAAVAFQTQAALVVADADCTIQRVNQAFVTLTGHAPDDVVGEPLMRLFSRQDDEAFGHGVLEKVRREGVWQGEQWVRARRGQPRVARVTVSIVLDSSGLPSHYVCSMVDLTSEHEAHASVEHMTFFDPLTDLPNRLFLFGRLQHLLDGGGPGDSALLLIDLDHFKRINDLRGHAAGDRLLAQVALRLRRVLDEHCVLCRFSGGTFALLEGCRTGNGASAEAQAVRCADRVRELLCEPFALGDDKPATITASIGWTRLLPGHGSPETVLREAELAMYEAKAAGRDQVCRYQPGLQAELARRELLVNDLREAIAQDALDLHLQAQVDRQGRVVCAECLLRWTRPDGEAMPPARFIPLAEENGLILPLGTWVLRRACVVLAGWATSAGGLSLAVNVSARQFAQPGFVDEVRDALAASGAPPTRLKLEITETAILGNLDAAADKLRSLRALGIRIALDDFGTGYSSLAYLSRLPLDQIKIDQSFVARLPDDANDAMVAQTIIGMGHGLGLEVAAEGVESEAQRQFLLAQGCDVFQGYLFARPLPSAEFEAALAGAA